SVIRGQCETFVLNRREGLYKNKSSGELLEKAAVIMQRVIKETDRASEITKRLTEFTKPVKAEVFEKIDLKKEIDGALDSLSSEPGFSAVKIVKNTPDGFFFITADKKQIRQILINILKNASQSLNGPIGGKKIMLAIEKEKHFLKIEIKDTGCGIKKEIINKVFDPFFTTKNNSGGTGLGLFIVKQLVDRNKGRIEVKSGLGAGTMVTLRFPRSGMGS
ncbi:MAG: HAMP domain-containing sensor histidine kinase, partial [Candidatus Omnitrophota bacterium]|nr:HAMP domain-containing sensor histidine kinase [Candidatus Omnitrophota bacterium]